MFLEVAVEGFEPCSCAPGSSGLRVPGAGSVLPSAEPGCLFRSTVICRDPSVCLL